MLKIDADNMLICLTRGDTANIVFSAVDDTDTPYEAQIGDELKFAVSKKVGQDPIMDIQNVGDATNIYVETAYIIAEITAEEYAEDPTKYWYQDAGGDYVQCTALDPYDQDETYYTQEEVKNDIGFWTITIDTEDWLDGGGNDKFKFADYVFDVQLTHKNENDEYEVDTIIGTTDEIQPTFRVWGEVATEG